MKTLAAVVVWLAASTSVWADAPRDVLAEARAHERAGEWQSARESYGKLEAFDDWRGVALYGEGWSAFQLGDFAEARDLAARAITARGGRRDEARVLYGDALFKLGEFERARSVYLATAKVAAGTMRKMLDKKIVACDRMIQKTT